MSEKRQITKIVCRVNLFNAIDILPNNSNTVYQHQDCSFHPTLVQYLFNKRTDSADTWH